MSRQMRLVDLVHGAPGDIVVTGLTADSRAVRPGDAFFAVGGFGTHGLRFAAQARQAGASAVLYEPPAPDDIPVPADAIPVQRLRARMGEIADQFHGRPSSAMTMVGVTGTSGKTSTVQLLAQALKLLGVDSGTIGTLGAGRYGAAAATGYTTPMVLDMHGLLGSLRDDGVQAVAMEVSSHALDQGRVDAVHYDIAVFTNLTRDHLDYHGTMAEYGAAKQRLFTWPGLGAAIINVDDAFGRALLATLRQAGSAGGAPRHLLRYGLEHEADVVASAVRADAAGLAFQLATPWGEGEVASRLLGRFNVSNLLAVAACLGRLGFAFDAIRDALGALEPVAGRMNRIGGDGTRPLVVVDYAHTPDALEQALTSLRAHCAGRLVCVFGCGGERDAGKRPQMAAIAEALADRIIVTDDNPRGEDGDRIVADVVAGLRHPQRATIERDRAAAIALAIAEAGAADVVLVAGKGHEPYQEVAGTRRPFDDIAVARGVLGVPA